MTKSKIERVIDRGIADFRKNSGGRVSFRFIPSWCMEEMEQAADKGDADARSVIMSLANFFEVADAAAEDGVFPACVGCGAAMKPGTICGFGILTPLAAKETTGLVAVYCKECINGNDSRELMKMFLEHMRDSLGAVVTELH